MGFNVKRRTTMQMKEAHAAKSCGKANEGEILESDVK